MQYTYNTVSPKLDDNIISQPNDTSQINSYSEWCDSIGGGVYGISGNIYSVKTKNEREDY